MKNFITAIQALLSEIENMQSSKTELGNERRDDKAVIESLKYRLEEWEGRISQYKSDRIAYRQEISRLGDDKKLLQEQLNVANERIDFLETQVGNGNGGL